MVRKTVKLSLALLLACVTFTAYSAFAASDTKYEAEDANFGALEVESEAAGFSGKGYVNLKEGPSIEWTVNVPADGKYPIKFGYQLPADFGSKQNTLAVNGTDIGEVDFAISDKFTESAAVKVDLKAGDNKITIKKSWGWVNYDYLTVVGGSAGEAAAATGGDAGAANPKTGDVGLAPYLALAAAAGVVLVATRKKWVKN
ncbi:MAG: CBM35 domain-containing protein [Candidatus Cohnella colombiensis]|uniref:CBM35 domain-containing protein n=1 Tax=Candidatus Cohnella colombiensis TaxID=3121368 RepID=A0AA95JGZ8_9BACL|nr:MAG: CBM35 domain-containing protein [Cohnella sp.]